MQIRPSCRQQVGRGCIQSALPAEGAGLYIRREGIKDRAGRSDCHNGVSVFVLSIESWRYMKGMKGLSVAHVHLQAQSAVHQRMSEDYSKPGSGWVWCEGQAGPTKWRSPSLHEVADGRPALKRFLLSCNQAAQDEIIMLQSAGI